MNFYADLLKAHIQTLSFLKLSLEYILLFDNSTQWQKSLDIVNQTINTYTYTK